MPFLLLFPVQRSHCYESHVVHIIDQRIFKEPKELFLIFLKSRGCRGNTSHNVEQPGEMLRKGTAEALGHLWRGRF